MGNIRKLKADYKQCTYNLIANEILLIKMQDDTRVSLAAKGLFWQLMNLPDEWELNETGLSTITGESTYKIKNLLKELKDWGYISSKMEQNEKGICKFCGVVCRDICVCCIHIGFVRKIWNGCTCGVAANNTREIRNIDKVCERVCIGVIGCGHYIGTFTVA